jgi:hypothetical protein
MSSMYLHSQRNWSEEEREQLEEHIRERFLGKWFSYPIVFYTLEMSVFIEVKVTYVSYRENRIEFKFWEEATEDSPAMWYTDCTALLHFFNVAHRLWDKEDDKYDSTGL